MKFGTAKDGLRPFIRIVRLLKFLLFLFLGGVILCLIVAGALYVWPDIDPVEDSDLVLKKREGRIENLSQRFVALVEKLKGVDELMAWQQYHGRGAEIRETPIGGKIPSAWSDCVESNRLFWAEFEELLPELESGWSIDDQDPVHRSSDGWSTWDEKCSQFIFFTQAALEYHRIRGEAKEGMRLLSLRLRFSWAVTGASDAFGDYILGAISWEDALKQVYQAFGTGYFDEKQTRELIQVLAEYQPTKDFFQNALIGEYLSFKRSVHQIAETGKIPRSLIDPGPDQDAHFFQPHRTIAMAEATLRRVLESLKQAGYVHEAGLSHEAFMEEEPRGKWEEFWYFLGPNYRGHKIGDEQSNMLVSVHSICFGLAAGTELARTLLALDLYQRENGQYPDELDSLAPDFLPEIPRDAFDSESSLRYVKRPDGGADLWSVGPKKISQIGEEVIWSRPSQKFPHLESASILGEEFGYVVLDVLRLQSIPKVSPP